MLITILFGLWLRLLKKSSNDPFSKRIAFYDVDKTSTAKASFIPYGNAVLKDIKLELTRQRRK